MLFLQYKQGGVMKDFFIKYIDKFIVVVSVVLILLLINNIIDKFIDRTIRKRRKKNVTTLLMFIKKVKKLVLYVLGTLVIIGQFEVFSGFSKTLLSGLGIGSVVLGLAAQESLKNFFGSFALVIGDAYQVGDFIECVDKNVSGTVEDITMRHTIIRTINNRRVLIPNSQMNTYTIENFNYGDNETVKLVEFPVAYEADVDKAIKIIESELKKLYHPNPKGKNKDVEFPKVRISNWNDSSISLRAWVWGKDNTDTFENMYIMYYNVKKSFEKNNIEIPYPKVVTINKRKNS